VKAIRSDCDEPRQLARIARQKKSAERLNQDTHRIILPRHFLHSTE